MLMALTVTLPARSSSIVIVPLRGVVHGTHAWVKICMVDPVMSYTVETAETGPASSSAPTNRDSENFRDSKIYPSFPRLFEFLSNCRAMVFPARERVTDARIHYIIGPGFDSDWNRRQAR